MISALYLAAAFSNLFTLALELGPLPGANGGRPALCPSLSGLWLFLILLAVTWFDVTLLATFAFLSAPGPEFFGVPYS